MGLERTEEILQSGAADAIGEQARDFHSAIG
jgi:hypothetical protein